jgi:RHS repeat-associated protein
MTFLLIAALCGALHAGAGPVEWSSGVTYTYDASGNITLIGTDHHVYDVAGRLVQSDTNGIRRNFEYDGFGNRTNCLQQPATNCQYGYEVDQATNRLDLPPGSYDDVGNLKMFEGRTFDYDALDMLITNHTQVPGTEFIYTADDERIAVYTVPAAQWRWTLRDPSGKVLREMTSRNGTGADELGTTAWTWTKDSVWRGDQLLASRQIEAGNANPTTYHYHLDHLGTPRRITNDTDAIIGIHDYHAYGREASGGTNEPSLSLLKYTGHERDIVGTEGSETLDYMHARYYSPTVGRFLSVDPGKDWDPRNPQTWNRYTYAHNSPLLKIDPDGRAALAVVYPDYKISVGGIRVPQLGHAGVVSIDNRGRTKYYEYGRYDSKHLGVVRRVGVPDVVMGSNGYPTKESMQKLMAALSTKSGQGGAVEGAFFKDADAAKVNAYAAAREDANTDPDRKSYGLFTNSCSTFMCSAVKAGGGSTFLAFSPRPIEVIQDLQRNSDMEVSYKPGTPVAVDCNSKDCEPNR